MAGLLARPRGAAVLSDAEACRRRPARSRRCSADEAARAGRRARRHRPRCSHEIAAGDLYDLQERYVAAVRPHALAVAASVRARARRKPRPRPGDGRPARALRQSWPGDDRERAARLPAAVPRIPLPAAGRPRRARLLGRTAHILRALADRLAARDTGLCACSGGAGRDWPQAPAVESIRDPGRRPGRPRRAGCRLGGSRGPLRPQASRRMDAAPTGCGRGMRAATRATSSGSSLRRGTMSDLAEQRPVRLVSLSLPDRLPARQPAALRPRAIHLAHRLEPAAAPAPADVGLEPVPCRHSGDLRRSLRRPADADLRSSTRSASATASSSCWRSWSAASPASSAWSASRC